MTDDELRKLAEAALSKTGPWCGHCGEAFSTREPELARAVLRLLEDKAQAHWAMKARAAECCDGWKGARQHDYGCPYMAWVKADCEREWRERALAAEKKLAELEEAAQHQAWEREHLE